MSFHKLVSDTTEKELAQIAARLDANFGERRAEEFRSFREFP